MLGGKDDGLAVLLGRGVALEVERTGSRLDHVGGLVGRLALNAIDLEKDVAKTDTGGFGGGSVKDMTDGGALADGVDGLGVGVGKERLGHVGRLEEEDAKLGDVDASIVVLSSRGKAIGIKG